MDGWLSCLTEKTRGMDRETQSEMFNLKAMNHSLVEFIPPQFTGFQLGCIGSNEIQMF